MAKVRLTRKQYYATAYNVEVRRGGALHESADCAGLMAAAIDERQAVRTKTAAVWLASGRWHLCKRCRGMK